MIFKKHGTLHLLCLSENQVYTSIILIYVLGKVYFLNSSKLFFSSTLKNP